LNLALAIYKEANVPQKTVAALAELGHFDLILQYCESVGYRPDYNVLLQHIGIVPTPELLSYIR
jgi:clathrin heavy chain